MFVSGMKCKIICFGHLQSEVGELQRKSQQVIQERERELEQLKQSMTSLTVS